MKIVALFVLVTLVALVPFLGWLTRKRNTLTPDDVVSTLEAFLSEFGSRYDWEDFVSRPINDPALDAIRVRCLGLPGKFPPQDPHQYCSEAGRDVLRAYVAQLRARCQTSPRASRVAWTRCLAPCRRSLAALAAELDFVRQRPLFMNDPHVTSVVYSVGSGPGIEYDDPPPLIHESALGVFRLSQDRLQVTPTEHFAREEEARSAIEPFLRAWEAETDLVANPETIRFTFVSADVVDRNPEPNVVTGRLVATLGSVTVLGSAVTLTLRRRSYPEPPRSFRLTEEAEIALRRWRRYLAGTEPLQAMAYFVLTLLNAQSRRPLSAARLFAIESPILKKIGELSSTRGDALNARKVNSEARFTPLTGTEQQWLETAVRKLILRLGEYGTGTPLTPIRVKDLPFP